MIVVFLHFLMNFFPLSMNNNNFIKNLFLYPPLGNLVSGRCAVCLFFILSGYVLSYNYLDGGNNYIKILSNIIKRPIRLVGVVVFSAYAVFLCYPEMYNRWDVILLQSICNPFSFGININHSLWTIPIELRGSFITFGFLLFFCNFRYRIIVLLGMLLYYASTLYCCFVVGIILADILKNYVRYIEKYKQMASMIILIPALYFTAYPYYSDTESIKNVFYGWLPDIRFVNSFYPLLGAVLIFLFVNLNEWTKAKLNHGVFLFIGKISYSLYAIHAFVLYSLSRYLYSITESCAITILVSLPVIITISWLVDKFVDQPIIMLANAIGNMAVLRINQIWGYVQSFKNICNKSNKKASEFKSDSEASVLKS